MFVSSFVHDGETNIDPYHEGTIDKALVNGSYYMDKAPGMSFMAIPIYYGIDRIGDVIDLDTRIFYEEGEFAQFYGAVSHMISFGTSGLLAILAAICMVFVADRFSASRSAAFLTALTFSLATPAWGLALQFYGHVASAAFLFIAFGSLFAATSTEQALVRPRLLSAIAGWSLAAAVVIEFTTAPAAAIIAAYGLWKLADRRPDHWWQMVAAAVLAGAVPGVLLLAYNVASFGDPFVLGYNSVVGFDGMEQGFLGLTYPKVEVAAEILFGRYRGLLVLSPVMIAVPFGFLAMWRHRELRLELALCAAIIVYFILFNASYHYWYGGSSIAPRHLTPMIPFAVLPLVFVWKHVAGLKRILMYGLFAASVGISMICASTTMNVYPHGTFPLAEVNIPRFLSGNLQIMPLSNLDGLAFDLDSFPDSIEAGLHLGVAAFVALLIAIYVLRIERGREAAA